MSHNSDPRYYTVLPLTCRLGLGPMPKSNPPLALGVSWFLAFCTTSFSGGVIHALGFVDGLQFFELHLGRFACFILGIVHAAISGAFCFLAAAITALCLFEFGLFDIRMPRNNAIGVCLAAAATGACYGISMPGSTLLTPYLTSIACVAVVAPIAILFPTGVTLEIQTQFAIGQLLVITAAICVLLAVLIAIPSTLK